MGDGDGGCGAGWVLFVVINQEMYLSFDVSYGSWK